MTKTLKQKTMHGLLWSSFERFGTQGIQFVISIILARLLAPEQFGLIAMLTIFNQLASCFIDSGFGRALIRKKDATQTDISSVFYLNIAVSIIIWLLLCAASPFIAKFYKQPILQYVTCAITFTLVINSLGLIQRTLLTKDVNFKAQFWVSLPCIIISGTIGIICAYRGLGVWALVIQTLSASFIATVLLWYVSKWRPTLTFSIASIRVMFKFASRLLISEIINVAFNNIYLLVIGKFYNATALGYYSRAFRLQMFPSSNITNIVNRVAYPVFAHIHDEPARLRNAMGKAMRTLALINSPLMIGMAVCAKPLIMTLLTDKWLPCVPYFQLLCFIGFLLPFHVINLSIIQAIGRSDLFLKVEIYKKTLVALNIVITYRWGIMAMIQGQLIVSFISYLLNAYFGGKYVHYKVPRQIADITPYILASAPMAGICYYLYSSGQNSSGITLFDSSWFSINVHSDGVILFKQLLAGCASWILTCRILKLEAFMEIWTKIISKISGALR